MLYYEKLVPENLDLFKLADHWSELMLLSYLSSFRHS